MSVINVNMDVFENLKKSDKTVLLDFFASWCAPCRMVSPIVDEIAEENPQFEVGKIDVEAQPELAQMFGVMSIPTLVVMKNGEIVKKNVGAMTKQQILDMMS